MSSNYILHLQGSPYLNEGFFGNLKAKAKSAGQQLSAVRGKSVKPLSEVKFQSLFDDWVFGLNNVFDKDFDEKNPNSMYNLFLRTIPAKDRKNIKAWKNVRDFSSEVNKLSTYRRIGKDPTSVKPIPNPPKTPPVTESIWSRPRQLTNAIRSNDYKKVIDAYKTFIKNSTNNFIKNSSNELKVSNKDILNTIKTKYSEFLKKLGGVLNIKTEIVGLDAQPSAINQTSTAPDVNKQQVSPEQPQAVVPEEPKKNPESIKAFGSSVKQKESKSNNVSPMGAGTMQALSTNADISNDDVVLIVDKTLEVLINAIEKDTRHYGSMMDNVKEYTEKAKKIREQEKEEPIEVEKIANNFIYNISSEYRKHRDGTEEVPLMGMDTSIKSAGIDKMVVYWKLDNKSNIIQVLISKGDYEYPLYVMMFYDHDGIFKNKIEDYIENINPYLSQMYGQSNSSIKSNINSKMEIFNDYITGIGFKKIAALFKSAIARGDFEITNMNSGELMERDNGEKFSKEMILKFLSNEEDADFASGILKFLIKHPDYDNMHHEIRDAAERAYKEFGSKHIKSGDVPTTPGTPPTPPTPDTSKLATTITTASAKQKDPKDVGQQKAQSPEQEKLKGTHQTIATSDVEKMKAAKESVPKEASLLIQKEFGTSKQVADGFIKDGIESLGGLNGEEFSRMVQLSKAIIVLVTYSLTYQLRLRENDPNAKEVSMGIMNKNKSRLDKYIVDLKTQIGDEIRKL